ncbi:MAG: acyl-CoA dehydrogenase family protein [Rhodospirillales bacterium]|nr:acyl-CoA dehydrogenase family protein [Rhodospirillales bacterium]
MDFDLSEEQRLLKDSVERLIAERYRFEDRKKYLASSQGHSAELWNAYAELGLLGLPFPEAFGGFGGGAVETAIVMEAFGRGLILEPYFATVILGGGLLRRLAPPETQAALLPQLAAGTLRLAFAHLERHSRWNLADVATEARRGAAGITLHGAKSVVLHGDLADRVLVTARSSGARADRGGVGLYMVDPTAPGTTRRGYPTQDGLRAAEMSFDGAAAEPLGAPDSALPAIEAAVDAAIAALCAEAVGAMTALQELTLEYLKTRKQFGRPIGSFQALQHRAVDMLTAVEQARSMALYVTVAAESDDATERRRAVTAAKAQIGRAARQVGQEAIQLHGGIGMTMEYAAGHYFKRLTMIDQMFGDADRHLAELAALGGIFGAAA